VNGGSHQRLVKSGDALRGAYPLRRYAHYLGVTLDTQFDPHPSGATETGSFGFYSKLEECLQLILSMLDYACPIWRFAVRTRQ